ncbi:hypothetical protein HY624_01440 [Candidatus Uhrbacteria bacterium]|nr:hypothetical protein [Candidatus Uhrbacteria bacterium]
MTSPWKKFIAREGVDVLTISSLDIVFYACIREYDKKTREPFFTRVQDRVLTHYLCVDPLPVGRKIYPIFFKTPAHVQRYYREGLKFLSHVRRITRAWKKKAARSDHAWQLAAFKEFRKQFLYVNYTFSIWPWWGIESWQTDADALFNTLIERRGLQDRRDELLASIYHPWKKTAIIELQDHMRHGVAIPKLLQRYQFLRSWSVVWYRPINKQWIEDFKKQNIAGAHMKLLPRAALARLLRPTKKERWFLDIAPYIIFFKDWRDDVRRTHVYEWSFFWDALAERFHVERNDLGYLSFDEMEQAIKTDHFPVETVAYRKSHPCIITTSGNDRNMTVHDKNIRRYLSIINAVDHAAAKSIAITGLIAQTGKARGIVRILKTYHDIKKFKQGEILVANTTHPNYLPAMQKAAAFVTNEGGIVSHASIVARELKKPCIVGTKNATDILKDGDVVEVDAERGIIKKIS